MWPIRGATQDAQHPLNRVPADWRKLTPTRHIWETHSVGAHVRVAAAEARTRAAFTTIDELSTVAPEATASTHRIARIPMKMTLDLFKCRSRGRARPAQRYSCLVV